MRIVINIVIFICAFTDVKAQINFVRNGSFEHYNSCPKIIDQIHLAKYWSTIDTGYRLVIPSGDTISMSNCAPEYVNVCAGVNVDVGIPRTRWFYQYPRTGNGMTQVSMYTDDSNPLPMKRDYLLGRLYDHLIAGKDYCVTFYVSFNGIYNNTQCNYAVDHIGAYLDDGTICEDTGNICGLPKPWITPQVYTTAIITDTVNWTKIQGSFVANGTEKFITIGNFFDNAHTNYIVYPSSPNNHLALYLVDDVSIIESTAVADAGPDKGVAYGDSVWIGTNEEGMPCTWYVAGDTTPVGYSGGIWVKPTVTTTYVVEMDLCGNVTRDSVKVTVWPVGETSPRPSAKEREVLPNPARDELHVVGEVGDVVRIYDVVGKEVYKSFISSEKEVINIGSLQKGIYFIHVVAPGTGQRFVRKIVKE